MTTKQQKALLIIMKNYLGCPVDAQELTDAMALLMGTTQDTASPTE